MVSHEDCGVIDSGNWLHYESSFSRGWWFESKAITHKEKIKVEFRKMSEKFEELNLPNAVIKRIIKEKIPSG